MAVKVKAIPDGYHTVTPCFTVRDAARAVEFYKRAFGAVELMRMADSSGKIRHAEIRIGDSPIMLSDEFPEFPEMRSFQALGGFPVSVYLYVEDVDALFNRAVAAGAKVRTPPSRMNFTRPSRRGEGSVRPRVVHRNPQGGCRARREMARRAKAANA
jgi:PhnB protein